MLCKIVKQDESWYEANTEGWSKMPIFGRGKQTWYKLIDHSNDENYCFDRYSITKSFVDDENDRCYTDVPIQDKEANHLINGHALVIDEDHIVLDKRTKAYRNQ